MVVLPSDPVQTAKSNNPPLWQDHIGLVSCSHFLCVEASTGSVVLAALRVFFEDSLKSELGSLADPWAICATSFVEYVAIGVEARIFELPSQEQCSPSRGSRDILVQMKHTSCNDVVRFRRLVVAASAHLGAGPCLPEFGKHTSHQKQLSGCLDDQLDGFLFDDDFDEEEEQVWADRIDFAFEALVSESALDCEETVQSVASWAEAKPCCLQLLLHAFAKAEERSNLVSRIIRAGHIAEQYPLAAAMKYASLSCETEVFSPADKRTFLDGLLPLLNDMLEQQLPMIVRCELSKAVEIISKIANLTAAPDSQCGLHKKAILSCDSQATTTLTGMYMSERDDPDDSDIFMHMDGCNAGVALAKDNISAIACPEMPSRVLDLHQLTASLWEDSD